MTDLTDKVRQRRAEKVTLIGSAVDLTLGVTKVLVGIVGHSTALVADGVHSLSDLATDFMVILVMRHSSKAPDQQHPFGHLRFETVATLALGLILVGVALTMAWQSIQQWLDGRHQDPSWPVLLVAFLSIIGKEWVYRFSIKLGRELQSDLLIANAWHARSDAFSSVVVLVGVAGTMLGAHWMDALAAVGVALLIAKIGWDMVCKNLSELVDAGLPEQQVKSIEMLALQVPGVEQVHQIRGRTMAGQILLELHLVVDNRLSASEAHFVGNQVRGSLLASIPAMREVIFHIDTHTNQQDEKSRRLPDRQTIQQQLTPLLMQLTQGEISSDKDYELTLYYTSDRVDMEIKLLKEITGELSQDLQQKLQAALQQESWLGRIEVWR